MTRELSPYQLRLAEMANQARSMSRRVLRERVSALRSLLKEAGLLAADGSVIVGNRFDFAPPDLRDAADWYCAFDNELDERGW